MVVVVVVRWREQHGSIELLDEGCTKDSHVEGSRVTVWGVGGGGEGWWEGV